MMSSFWRLLGYADEAGHIDGQEEQPQGWLSWLSSFVVATPPASLSQDGEDSDSEREDIESHGTTTPTQPRKRDSSPPPTAAPLVEVVKHVESPVDYKPVISTFSDLPKVQSARLETPQRNRSQRPAGTVRTVSRKHMREEWPSLSQEYVEVSCLATKLARMADKAIWQSGTYVDPFVTRSPRESLVLPEE
eukprot:TRINITY_DN252_c0_g1_i2.p1 TRINITY_DN252_c0_g1~~TRINITY_DN252_c0_g1_i2.p1  ORF type:complete len:191 (-),score=6.39 TRINITY_DN252_c0_g1_i2:257-829(-)